MYRCRLARIVYWCFVCFCFGITFLFVSVDVTFVPVNNLDIWQAAQTLGPPQFERQSFARVFSKPHFSLMDPRKRRGWGNLSFSLVEKVLVTENACFASRDGMYGRNAIPHPQMPYPEGIQKTVTPPRRPRELSDFIDDPYVYELKGVSLVVNCWRQRHRLNPSHFMMGYGKLYSVKLVRAIRALGLKIRNIILHQCTDFNHSAYTRYMWDRAIERLGEESVLESEINTIQIPMIHPADVAREPDEPLFCTSRVLSLPWSVGRYLDFNEEEDVKSFRNAVKKDFMTPARTLGVPAECNEKCKKNLRIAIWVRTEGKGLRRFHNFGDVYELAQSYTNEKVEILGATSKTPVLDQGRIFSSFDILLTPHGSQVANMVFCIRPLPVFVEVLALNLDLAFCENSLGLAAGWIQSYGHSLVENGNKSSYLDSLVQQCWTNSSFVCPKRSGASLFKYDLLVDIYSFQLALEKAIEVRCGCIEREHECTILSTGVGIPNEFRENFAL